MEATQDMVVFNPQPQIECWPLADGHVCYVVDDALLKPERVLEWAAARGTAFRRVDFNAYPGNYLMLPAAAGQALRDFFVRHVRGLFDARRLLQMSCRLSMVTLPPQALRPYQWLCHSDRFGLAPAQSIQASVLYLFKDEGLGGTGFYKPARPAAEIAQLFGDANTLSAEDFSDRYGIEPGYLLASNAWFTRTGGVPARWNRLIFYDGSLLHSGDILAPDRLSPDPKLGRLTFNAFFTCHRKAA